MARKYTRDNRGRFASGGGGATARGGRLRTAGGNKRATQTMQRSVKPGSTARAGVMRKPAPANNAPMTRKDRESIAAVKRGKAGKPNAEDRMIQQAMARRGVNARLGQPMQTKPAPKAKAPREQRLERAIATATRIEKKRQAKADATREEFAKRRQISSRAGRKGKFSAFQKEDQASARSANAMRSWLRAGKRVESLRSAKGAR